MQRVVLAYSARLPLRSAGSAVSDDRGVFRISGLEPGKYWVRSGAHTLDDGSGWLPTYGPRGEEVREARIHRVTVHSDTTDVDVSPEAGSLFHLGGGLVWGYPRDMPRCRHHDSNAVLVDSKSAHRLFWRFRGPSAVTALTGSLDKDVRYVDNTLDSYCLGRIIRTLC
jgi:hypothetical protein